jgi:hypothetical protein
MIALEEIMSMLRRALLSGAVLPEAPLRRFIRLLPAIALFLFAISCSGFFVSENTIQSVAVSPTAVILHVATATAVGDTYTLSSQSTTVGGTTADDTATDGGQSGSCTVYTYSGTAPSTLSMTYSSGIDPNLVNPGAVFQVFAAADINGSSSQNISSYVTWSSSDTSNATVDTKGNVTVLSTATASTSFTITATATFASATVTGTQTYTVN